MTTRDVDRLLTTWLEADAPVREPDHLLGDVLARTSRTRRRPGWVFLERWIPMQRAMRFQTLPRLRPMVAVVALLILALALAAVYAGGQRRKPPSLTGLANNGDLVYVSNGELWTARADGSNPHAIAAGGRSNGVPVFSPDGMRIAYLGYPVSTMVDAHLDDARPSVVVTQADGSGPVTILPEARWTRHLAWTPDSSRIVFSRFWDEAATYQHDRIFIAAAAGSSPPVMISDPNVAGFDPAVSTDGRMVAFLSDHYDPAGCPPGDCNGENSYGLHVMAIDGTGGRVLAHSTTQPAYDLERWARPVDWHPDGRSILFTGIEIVRPTWYGIFRVPVDGSTAPQRIDTGAGAAYGATFAPDGRRIAYLREGPGGTWDAVVADPDGQNQRVVRSGVERFAPKWSPDGRSIVVFEPVTSSDVTMRIVSVDGGRDDVVLHATSPSGDASQLGIDLVGWQRNG